MLSFLLFLLFLLVFKMIAEANRFGNSQRTLVALSLSSKFCQESHASEKKARVD